MTPAVKDRYLQVLGFKKTAKTEPKKQSKNEPNDPKGKWSSSDGNWVRQTSPGDVSAKSVTEEQKAMVGSVADKSKATVTAENEIAKAVRAAEIDQLWADFKKRGKSQQRDELIVYYSPLVKYVASRVAAGLPQTVDQADLVSYGMFGLIDAINKFDLERGYKFETYAILRIKGSILDEMRSVDWIPRSIRAKAKSVEKAIAKLETKHHRSPTDEEIAKEMGLSMTQLHTLYTKISSLGVVALDDMLNLGGSETITYGDTLADRSDGPGRIYENQETRQVLAGAINSMGERERVVLTLYYYEGLTLSEIGDVLAVTESRICQIHTKAVLELRSKLGALSRDIL